MEVPLTDTLANVNIEPLPMGNQVFLEGLSSGPSGQAYILEDSENCKT